MTSPQPSTTDFAPAGFELLGRLGRGGMAEVWLARRAGATGVEKLVVLKRILPGWDDQPDLLEMFLCEARISARLSHPNIAQVYEYVAEPAPGFLVLEFVHGVALDELQRRFGPERPTPATMVCRLGADIAAGLQHAHRLKDFDGTPLGVVHRDISPQNVLVSFDGVTKVVDFGIAKARTQTHRTRTGVVKGKLIYMSPEQARGEALDGRSDVFSLGIVLYELLTGVQVFARDTDREIFMAIDACSFAPPSQHRADVPAELEAALMKALAPDRDDRFPDARALQIALARVASTCPDAEGSDLGEMVSALFPDRADLGLWIETLRDRSFPNRLPGSPKLGAPAPTPQRTSQTPTDRLRSPVSDRRPPLPSTTPLRPPAAAASTGTGEAAPEENAPARRSAYLAALLVAGAASGGLAMWMMLPAPSAPQVRAPAPAIPTPSVAAPTATVVHPPPAAVVPPSESTPSTSLPPRAAKVDRRVPGKRRPPEPAGKETQAPRNPPAEATPLQPAGFGYVTFDIAPWAEVELDGKHLGKTPLASVRVAAGRHQVRFRNESFGIDRRVAFELTDGQSRKIKPPPRSD